MFIDVETMAISRVEFNINVENRPQATAIFIRRKPAGLRAQVEYAGFGTIPADTGRTMGIQLFQDGFEVQCQVGQQTVQAELYHHLGNGHDRVQPGILQDPAGEPGQDDRHHIVQGCRF